ncbi:MAG: nitrilase-related carbon-nitrogen hydrolase [Phycisphaerales bacterium]|jgi:predicted amidohydrolase|nr:nitrilase-related carbon-nitrogen hydrolase [Phycisphaerales bacterium]
MQFHAIQHDVVPNDYKKTRLNIEIQIECVNPTRGDFIVLQEMTDTGWSMRIDKITGIDTVKWACELSQQLGVWIQVGWADCFEGRGKNCVSICSPSGEPVATYTKVFTCNPLNENDFYDSGNDVVVVDIGECRICPMICYDVRFPELWRPAAVTGVDVFTISSSWPLPRISHWKSLLIGRALENQAFIVASNRVGKDSLATWGGLSIVISPLGEVLSEASKTEEETLSETIDPNIARNWRIDFPVMNDVREELLGKIEVNQISA